MKGYLYICISLLFYKMTKKIPVHIWSDSPKVHCWWGRDVCLCEWACMCVHTCACVCSCVSTWGDRQLESPGSVVTSLFEIVQNWFFSPSLSPNCFFFWHIFLLSLPSTKTSSPASIKQHSWFPEDELLLILSQVNILGRFVVLFMSQQRPVA